MAPFVYLLKIYLKETMRTVKIHRTERELPVGKILCLGRNYAEHAKEMHSEVPVTPVVFLKPSTALLSSGEPIVIPAISQNLHHEVEFVVAIGRGGKGIIARDAYRHVLGYAVGLDMTLRDIQNEAKERGLPWAVAKGFDTSAPVSAIIPASEIPEPNKMTILCRVNGKERQRGSTADLIFTIPQIIEYVSSLFTLETGDLIFTGTPEGVGRVVGGDTIEAELAGHITITHTVQ
jgi:2-keto-4-pentenoate hydratase/2-oxohepta-3-ene-1,7-dioic acid hydratase in catechol pathway